MEKLKNFIRNNFIVVCSRYKDFLGNMCTDYKTINLAPEKRIEVKSVPAPDLYISVYYTDPHDRIELSIRLGEDISILYVHDYNTKQTYKKISHKGGFPECEDAPPWSIRAAEIVVLALEEVAHRCEHTCDICGNKFFGAPNAIGKLVRCPYCAACKVDMHVSPTRAIEFENEGALRVEPPLNDNERRRIIQYFESFGLLVKIEEDGNSSIIHYGIPSDRTLVAKKFSPTISENPNWKQLPPGIDPYERWHHAQSKYFLDYPSESEIKEYIREKYPKGTEIVSISEYKVSWNAPNPIVVLLSVPKAGLQGERYSCSSLPKKIIVALKNEV